MRIESRLGLVLPHRRIESTCVDPSSRRLAHRGKFHLPLLLREAVRIGGSDSSRGCLRGWSFGWQEVLEGVKLDQMRDLERGQWKRES